MSDILGSSPILGSSSPTSLLSYHLSSSYPTHLISSLSLPYFRSLQSLLFQCFLIILLFTYFFMILVSGGIFLAIVFIPFAGYKLYKKFGGCRQPLGNNSLFFCCSRRRRDGPGNFLRKRVVPRVVLDFPENLRVGETISLRVIFPLHRHRTLSIIQSRTSPHSPSLREDVILQEEYNLDHLTIEMVKLSPSSSPSSPPPPPIRELLPRTGGSLATEDVLLVKFLVQESGFYSINILYEACHVPGSPFPVPFNPGELHAPKTVVIGRGDSPLIGEAGGEVPLAVVISPRDRYGNECNYGDVNPDSFRFRLWRQGVKNGADSSGDSEEAILYNFSRSIKKTLAGECGWEENLEVRLDLEIFAPGVFQGGISYDAEIIGGGTLDFVVLSREEHETLRNHLGAGSPASAKYYEGKLLSIGGEVQKRPRSVYMFIGAKSLAIKEYYLAGLIPFRLANFRILPATRIKLLSACDPSGICILEISDRSHSQPRILLELEPSTTRLVLAIFSLYLQQRLGGSESFENKQKFFYQELVASRGDSRATNIVLNINRASIVNSTLAETRSFSGKDWTRNFKIKFIGEEGTDDGGLRREWLTLLCKELFDEGTGSVGGLFSPMGNSRLVHPNPVKESGVWTLKHYELAGKIVGKCLFETGVGGYYKQMVNARFSRSFLGIVIGYAPHYKYFEQDDPDLFISKVKYLLENDVSPMELTFTEDEYNGAGQLVKTVELLSNGRNIAIINENKEEYLNLLATYRLFTRVKREIEGFLKGLGEIVPEGLLNNFDENELELLMCGKSTFSVEDLKSHHVLSGEGAVYDRVLPWFWTALNNMTDEERARLLQFTTGSSLLPHGGFRELQPAFRITVYDSLGRLPLAHTCFSEICLSLHKNYEEFEKALKTAVNEGSEGFALL